MTCRHIQYADLHGCNVLCCRYFLRRVRVRFRVTVYTQLVVGVYWDSTPLTASAEIFKVYISFTLFTCDCTLIYTLMYCVCQHTDPGMAQIHRGLTHFESGRYIGMGGLFITMGGGARFNSFSPRFLPRDQNHTVSNAGTG